MREAAESGRLTGDRKVVFGCSARIRVKFRASQLYQTRGYSSYELSLELEASDNNETVSDWTVVNVGVGQLLKAAFEESRHNHDRAGFQPLCSLSRVTATSGPLLDGRSTHIGRQRSVLTSEGC